jgi:hypothetical protein
MPLGTMGETYLLRRQQRHPNNHPTSLASTQRKSLLNPQRLHNLQRHGRTVPIREVLRDRGGSAVAKRLNGEEVNGIGKGFAVELLVVEGGSRAHGVDEDDGGFCGVNAVIGKAVTNVDAAEVGHFDGGYGGHGG